MKHTQKIIAIVGPTATGKTDIAIKLARVFDGEIISADSRLVYKDFNIGTAKPTAEEMNMVKHHMIDIADPSQTYTVGEYKRNADICIKDILARGKVPILAGGTGFYTKAVTEGLDIPEVDPDMEFRRKMQEFVEIYGRQALYDKLYALDPVTAKKLYSNDSFRITRALEVYKVTGKKMSELQTKTPPPYEAMYIGLKAEDRAYLYDRINKRVLIMLDMGLIDEVKLLIEKYGKTISMLKTLGYQQISSYLDAGMSLDNAIELAQQKTRNFAKRQLTWFHANKDIDWRYIDRESQQEICGYVIDKFKNEVL